MYKSLMKMDYNVVWIEESPLIFKYKSMAPYVGCLRTTKCRMQEFDKDLRCSPNPVIDNYIEVLELFLNIVGMLANLC